MVLLVALARLVLLILWVVAAYNGLVGLRNRRENAWSDVDVQLKRRYELIPNLVETVKGYAGHELKTLAQVTELRARAMGTREPAEKAAAEGALTEGLKSLFAVAESYPELRANQNFLALQEELAGIEEAIQNARRYFNAVVRDLNTKCESFPSKLIASAFGFERGSYFELDSAGERAAPHVQFQV